MKSSFSGWRRHRNRLAQLHALRDALEAPLAEMSELDAGNRTSRPSRLCGYHDLVPFGRLRDPSSDVDDLTENVVLSDYCFSNV